MTDLPLLSHAPAEQNYCPPPELNEGNGEVYNEHVLHEILSLVRNITTRMDEFERVKFRVHKPKKPRSNLCRCQHKNRSRERCRGYICKESSEFCFAHHTISTGDPRSQYLYSKKIKVS
jgi:cytochrome c peroxidase